MSKQSIVHGRILLSPKNLSKAHDFIYSLNDTNTYLKPSMFGGLEVDYDRSLYTYDGVVITFGASYKYIQYSWTDFIHEFEEILKNIDFENARIKLETGLEGTYDFFWKNKSEWCNLSDKEIMNQKYIETDQWYFGYGNRCRWGLLLSSGSDEPIFSFEDFTYPLSNSSKLPKFKRVKNLFKKNQK